MREIRDTFIHLLADNLTMPVHNVRRDTNNPGSEKLQTNCINVQFLYNYGSVQVGTQAVTIDVIHDDELTAVDWMKQVWLLLSQSFSTPLLDYTNPSSPVSTGTNIMWGRNRVRFTPIASDFFTRFRCTLPLEYHEPLS